MSLHQSVNEYLSLRHDLGFKLRNSGHLLPQFASYMDQAGAATVTIDLALAWARQLGRSEGWLRTRLSTVRGFACYLNGIDPSHQLLPQTLLPGSHQRVAPYIYTETEVSRLMNAAGRLAPDLRAATYTTLIGLLGATGLRSGEAIGLDRGDIDWDEGVLTIERTKFNKSRELVLHPTTVAALRRYDDLRRTCWPRPQTPAFFVSGWGNRLDRGTFNRTFRELVQRARLALEPGTRRPRPHDLRHTFAVNTLIDWYRRGVDINSKMHLLSTYLGHLNPSNTYWYISCTPALLALATERLEAAQAGVAS